MDFRRPRAARCLVVQRHFGPVNVSLGCNTIPRTVPHFRMLLRFVLIGLALTSALGQTNGAKTNTQIAEEIIKESIAAYKGTCPCPYSRNRAGRNCGGNSAYSKPGGAAPLCYTKDVTQKMIDEYRQKSKEPTRRGPIA